MDYLLSPPASLHPPRYGAAIAVLVLYSILLLLMANTYFRLLFTVAFNPGYVPRGAQWHANRKNIRKSSGRSRSHGNPGSYQSREKPEEAAHDCKEGNRALGSAYAPSNDTSAPNTIGPAPGLQDFYNRDVFICKGDGRPIWCSTCLNWKPDRAHHCREIGRCVRKMDHYCPWVGGVVSETSFKFFIQFVAWTAVYCIFNLIVMAILMAEYKGKTGTANVHWIITLAFAALFGVFTMGMTGSSVQFAILNTTTIENLSRKSIVWELAVHVPRILLQPPSFPIISYSAVQPTSGISGEEVPAGAIRTFAILHSKPGDNPWDLGPYRNFKGVMGENWYDWLLPLKYSPCCNHDRGDSQFAMGPVVERLRKDAGIALPEDVNRGTSHRRRRHRRRRRPREHTIHSDKAQPKRTIRR